MLEGGGRWSPPSFFRRLRSHSGPGARGGRRDTPRPIPGPGRGGPRWCGACRHHRPHGPRRQRRTGISTALNGFRGGVAQLAAGEVTRYSRQTRGRMAWIEQDSSTRKGMECPGGSSSGRGRVGLRLEHPRDGGGCRGGRRGRGGRGHRRSGFGQRRAGVLEGRPRTSQGYGPRPRQSGQAAGSRRQPARQEMARPSFFTVETAAFSIASARMR